LVIVISYAQMEFEAAKKHVPTLAYPDDNNRVIK
jgi:aspartate 1-decarboxylase